MEIQKFTDSNAFWDEVLAVVSEAYGAREDQFRLAMSGGSAARLFDVMRDHSFDWSDSEIWMVDERFVPQDHEDSNARLLDAKLRSFEVKKRYIPICEQRAESRDQYAEMLTPDGDGYLFDLCVLGVGPDGHTASLFPNAPALDSTDLVATSETDRFAVRERLGLTFRAIEKSRYILVLMLGAGKADIYETIQKPGLDYHEYPAVKLLEMEQASVMWLAG